MQQLHHTVPTVGQTPLPNTSSKPAHHAMAAPPFYFDAEISLCALWQQYGESQRRASVFPYSGCKKTYSPILFECEPQEAAIAQTYRRGEAFAVLRHIFHSPAATEVTTGFFLRHHSPWNLLRTRCSSSFLPIPQHFINIRLRLIDLSRQAAAHSRPVRIRRKGALRCHHTLRQAEQRRKVPHP